MTTLPAGVRRLCVVTDVVGYSRLSNPDQYRAQQLLLDVVRGACRDAVAPFRRSRRQDSGDGVLLVLPPGINEPQMVTALITGFAAHLARVNRQPLPWGRLRMRLAMCQGIVHEGPTGFAGEAPVTACRLVDSAEVRAALQARPDRDLAVILADDLYGGIVKQGYGNLPAEAFEHVRVENAAKAFAADAWVHVPEPSPHAAGRADAPAPGSSLRDLGTSYRGGTADVAATLGALAAAAEILILMTDTGDEDAPGSEHPQQHPAHEPYTPPHQDTHHHHHQHDPYHAYDPYHPNE